MGFAIGNATFTISREDLAFAPAGNGYSYGGIQSAGDLPFAIYGDVVLRNIYAIFDVVSLPLVFVFFVSRGDADVPCRARCNSAASSALILRLLRMLGTTSAGRMGTHASLATGRTRFKLGQEAKDGHGDERGRFCFLCVT